MARGRRTANATAAPNDETLPATSSLDDFDAEASLLALQKHVDAAANGVVDVDGAAPPPPPTTTGIAAPVSQPVAPGHLYAASASQLVARRGNPGSLDSDSEAQIHPDLRTAHSPGQPLVQPSYPAVPTPPGIMSSATPFQPPPPAAGPPSMSPQSAAPISSPPDAHGELPVTDGRKGPRRELSTSKRAAQNRAAQRAFRQRKEGYIKKLEQQVQDYADMESQYKMIQTENYALREYIIHLQSKLLDAKAELPQPPPNLNLAAPGASGFGTSASTAAANLLANAAAAAAVQQQQQQQQQIAVPAPPAAAAAVSDVKSDTSLARVAQAVEQLGGGSDDSIKNESRPDSNGGGEPMDTTSEDTIDRKLQKLAEPVASM